MLISVISLAHSVLYLTLVPPGTAFQSTRSNRWNLTCVRFRTSDRHSLCPFPLFCDIKPQMIKKSEILLRSTKNLNPAKQELRLMFARGRQHEQWKQVGCAGSCAFGSRLEQSDTPRVPRSFSSLSIWSGLERASQVGLLPHGEMCSA